MELELNGKTALITGASRGIGLAMAARFAEAGANVMITSRKAADLADAAAGLVAGGAAEEQVAWTAAHVGQARGRRRPVWPRRSPVSVGSTSWSTTPAPTRTSGR